jgi:hypothetical protein
MRLIIAGPRTVPEHAIRVAECGAGILCAIDDDEEGAQAIELPEHDEFHVLPELRENVAQHIHLVGPSGVGKSSWAGQFAERFRRERNGRVVVISADAADDPAIVADARFPVSADLADVDISQLAEGGPLLVIFDDVEGVPRDLSQSLAQFRKALLERGRKLQISTINIYHRGASGSATRDSLNEATGVVVFPRGGISSNTKYMLRNHFDIPDGFMTLLRKSRPWGRSVYISNTFPPIAVGGRRAALLDADEIEKIRRQESRAAQHKTMHSGLNAQMGGSPPPESLTSKIRALKIKRG